MFGNIARKLGISLFSKEHLDFFVKAADQALNFRQNEPEVSVELNSVRVISNPFCAEGIF